MNFNRICYVFPKTENFREDRPRLCYEYMYGWLDGYGVLFDPVIQSHFSSPALFSNGSPGEVDGKTFYITCSGSASLEFQNKEAKGLFISPPEADPALKRSHKERLQTPQGTFFYPVELPYQSVSGNVPAYLLGEKSPLLRQNGRMELYFEFFTMVGYWILEYPYKRLTLAADLLAGFLWDEKTDADSAGTDLRIDCQSYGIARLHLQWLLELLNEDTAEIAAADTFYLAAVCAWKAKEFDQAQAQLKKAFECLCSLRKKHVPVDCRFAEFPHAGILFPENGFFELEWPEGSRQILSAHLHDAENYGYNVSFELGASCWNELEKLYPDMIARFRTLWEKGRIELTNGTWGLPYSFVSPLALQYWQLKCGNAKFEQIFGRSPQIYQCQENAFTPQMPELLTHFNYTKVLHFSQNHGRPPCEEAAEILWQSPSGAGLPALVCSDPKQISLGINFFYDMPLQLFKHKDDKTLTAFSFMDLGFIPLREQMIRIAGYAPVFGRFVTPEELFGEEKEPPVKTYLPDDYNFSSDAFYRNYTNANALSQFEHVFSLTDRWRLTQMFDLTTLPQDDPIPYLLCSLEAHDCDRVQEQRPGEFYTRRTNETGPCLRDTLRELLEQMRCKMTQRFEEIYQKHMPEKSPRLFNCGEVPLTFAPVRHPEKYAGETFAFAGQQYVSGPFAPLALSEAAPAAAAGKISSDTGTAGEWAISVQEDKVCVQRGSKKVVFGIRDRLNGCFKLQNAEYFSTGSWLTAKLTFLQLEKRMEAVILEGITTPESEYITWHVRYAVPGDFREDARWDDCLSLSFEVDQTAEVSNFVPNMLSVTQEKKICSSGCLEVNDPVNGKRALLFSGVGNFRREDNRLDWLFHVANETVFDRELTISFSASHPRLLGRALTSGLLPLTVLPEKLPRLTAQNICIECKTAPDQWLISNLEAKETHIDLPEGYILESMTGEILSSGGLGPYQIALLTVK